MGFSASFFGLESVEGTFLLGDIFNASALCEGFQNFKAEIAPNCEVEVEVEVGSNLSLCAALQRYALEKNL